MLKYGYHTASLHGTTTYGYLESNLGIVNLMVLPVGSWWKAPKTASALSTARMSIGRLYGRVGDESWVSRCRIGLVLTDSSPVGSNLSIYLSV